jgi:hypothetical protein
VATRDYTGHHVYDSMANKKGGENPALTAYPNQDDQLLFLLPSNCSNSMNRLMKFK